MSTRGRDASRGSRPTADRRGQTTIDYGIGAALFVVVVAFTLAFTPTVLDPFIGDGQAGFPTADRGADQLATDLLVEDPAEPYVWDDDCTDEFFSNDIPGPSDCRYAQSGDSSLNDVLGYDSRVNANVTLYRNEVQVDSIGPTHAQGGVAVSTTSRVVHYDGRHHRMVVAVW
jgi:hypothetical protein